MVTYLRKGEICCIVTVRRERQCERNNPADNKVSRQERGGSAPGTRAEVPLQLVMKTMVMQVIPLQPVEDRGKTNIHLQPMKDPTLEQVMCPEGSCSPQKAHARAGSWQDLKPWRGIHRGAAFPAGHLACGGPKLEQFIPEACTQWNRLKPKHFVKNFSP